MVTGGEIVVPILYGIAKLISGGHVVIIHPHIFGKKFVMGLRECRSTICDGSRPIAEGSKSWGKTSLPQGKT